MQNFRQVRSPTSTFLQVSKSPAPTSTVALKTPSSKMPGASPQVRHAGFYHYTFSCRVCTQPSSLQPQAPSLQRGLAGHDDGGAVGGRGPCEHHGHEEGWVNKQPLREEPSPWSVHHTDVALRGGVLQQAVLLPRGPELHHRRPPRALPLAVVPWFGLTTSSLLSQARTTRRCTTSTTSPSSTASRSTPTRAPSSASCAPQTRWDYNFNLEQKAWSSALHYTTLHYKSVAICTTLHYATQKKCGHLYAVFFKVFFSSSGNTAPGCPLCPIRMERWRR